MSEKARHIGNFLLRHRAAAGLLEGLERDACLLKAVRRTLAVELRPHCLHATLEGERLCLLTDGPVWASRLRFAVPELLGKLRAQGQAASEVRVRTAPTSGGAQGGSGGVPLRLSRKTIAHLSEAAAAIDDPDLAAALRRLAGADEKPSPDQEAGKGRGA